MSTEIVAGQWREVEIALTGPDVDDPYLGIDVVVDFVHASGDTLARPAFWDGGRTWRVRYASPRADGSWTWSVRGDAAVAPTGGELTAAPAAPGGHPAFEHGFVTVPPASRAGRHADATPWLVVADTTWGCRGAPSWRTSRCTPPTAGTRASTPSC